MIFNIQSIYFSINSNYPTDSTLSEYPCLNDFDLKLGDFCKITIDIPDLESLIELQEKIKYPLSIDGDWIYIEDDNEG